MTIILKALVYCVFKYNNIRVLQQVRNNSSKQVVMTCGKDPSHIVLLCHAEHRQHCSKAQLDKRHHTKHCNSIQTFVSVYWMGSCHM